MWILGTEGCGETALVAGRAEGSPGQVAVRAIARFANPRGPNTVGSQPRPLRPLKSVHEPYMHCITEASGEPEVPPQAVCQKKELRGFSTVTVTMML